MKVYIIGKVTGLLYEEACELFNIRQSKLEEMGHEVVNPIEIVPEDTEWAEAMRICIAALVGCEAISVLRNATFSRGATLELEIANQLGMKRLFIND